MIMYSHDCTKCGEAGDYGVGYLKKQILDPESEMIKIICSFCGEVMDTTRDKFEGPNEITTSEDVEYSEDNEDDVEYSEDNEDDVVDAFEAYDALEGLDTDDVESETGEQDEVYEYKCDACGHLDYFMVDFLEKCSTDDTLQKLAIVCKNCGEVSAFVDINELKSYIVCECDEDSKEDDG